MLNISRFVYNKQLERKINAYKQNGSSLSQFDLNNQLVELKKTYKELKYAHSQVLQNVNHRITLAFSHFFRRVKRNENPGFPRFKTKERYNSLTFPQSGFQLDSRLYVSKVGPLKIVRHRKIEGKIKIVTIKKTRTNKWYAYVCVEEHVVVKKKEHIRIGDCVGIDVGLQYFYADSHGTLIENPKYLGRSEELLVKAHRRLSKKKRGSKKGKELGRVGQIKGRN